MRITNALKTTTTQITRAASQVAAKLIEDANRKARESVTAILQMDKAKRPALVDSDLWGATESPIDLLKFYFAMVRQLVKGAVGGPASAPYAQLKEADILLLSQALGDAHLQEAVRVKKVNGGYNIYMPCSERINTGLANIFGDSYYSENYAETRENIEAVFPGIWNLREPLDLDLGKAPAARTQIDVDAVGLDPELLPLIRKGIRGLRVVSSPSQDRFSRMVGRQDLIDAFEGTGRFSGDYEANMTLSKAWVARQLLFFVEFFLPQEAAEYITQETGDRVRMSALAEYFANMQHNFYGGGRDYLQPHVVSMTRIADDNRNMGVKPLPRVDKYGIAVNQRGELYWVPDADDPSFAEESVEAGGIQPNGEWTMLDMIDPEQNEYMQGINAAGVTARMRKPKGRNLLMYTDWHNSKLAYTADDSRMRIEDISMFRPATAMQYARVLDQDLTSGNELASDIIHSLTFAIRRGLALGVQLPVGPEYDDPYIGPETNALMRREFNQGNLPLPTIVHALDTCRRLAENENGEALSPEQYQALEQWLDKYRWPKLDMISPNSLSGILRAIHAFFVAVQEKLDQNPDLAFGEFSVMNTLSMVPFIRIVAQMGGKHEEVHLQDQEDRKLYLHPPLDAPDMIRVENIPWVSGSVELMPHQVKVWNYAQHFPRDLILDAAAGAGKTLMALLYIAYGIGQGKWKKPLILCPGDLVKNYLIDASWLFKGRVNIVVINGTTVNSPEWGEEKLIQLIEHAPINTIFISDYDFVVPKGNSTRVVKYVYGNQETQVSLNLEMLKRATWDMMVLDEAHLLKNAGSARNKEVMRLISTVPYKVEMSGTLISDNLTDIVGEYALINPQAFGAKDQFMDEFYRDGAPIPGAQKLIRDRMAETSMFVRAARKEWAALLPARDDKFYPVTLTPAQQIVYHKIMQLAEEEFKKLLQENADLRAALGGGGEDVDMDEVDLDALMESGTMGFYMQRLEQFVTAPSSDPDYGHELHGRDAVSPKLQKVVDICRHHISSGTYGKILVWTQYVESARSIYENLPDDLKAQAVHYTAGDADAAFAEFAQNPRKKIMIGCEKSMNTGHNLQHASRIIRLETVWNWGTLEQGESRINRPKRNDPRLHLDPVTGERQVDANGRPIPGIFYDWVFADKTIDVTKNSRMISKLISTVKFYEADNPAYMNLQEPHPIRLSRNNIFKVNSWQDEENGCKKYFDAYQAYQQLEEEDFRKFREDPNNRIEPYTLEEGHIPAGSGLLMKVPYIPGMVLYGQEKLGLIPFIEYVSLHKSKKKIPMWEDPDWSPEGMKIHTEYGDCEAVGYNKVKKGKPISMRVITPNGQRVSVPLAASWVITKDTTSGRDIRESLAKQAGAEVTAPVTPVVEVPKEPLKNPVDVGRGKVGKTPLPEVDPEGKLGGFELFVEGYDNVVSLAVDGNNPNVANVVKELHGMGFKETPAFYYTVFKNASTAGAQLTKWIAAVQAAGIKIHPAYLALLQQDAELLSTRKNLEKFLQGISGSARRNFFQASMKPLPKGTIKPYLAVITDFSGPRVLLCLTQRANASTYPKVRAIRVPGMTPFKGPLSGQMQLFLRNKAEAQTAIKSMFSKFNIENRREVLQDLNTVKFIPSKVKAQP